MMACPAVMVDASSPPMDGASSQLWTVYALRLPGTPFLSEGNEVFKDQNLCRQECSFFPPEAFVRPVHEKLSLIFFFYFSDIKTQLSDQKHTRHILLSVIISAHLRINFLTHRENRTVV
jgi:hypothetical protein